MRASLVALLKENVAPGVEYRRITAIKVAVAVCTDSIDSDNIALVLDSPGLK